MVRIVSNYSPTNGAESKKKTSATRTKLLENRHDPETSTARDLESSTHVDVDDVDLEISPKKV